MRKTRVRLLIAILLAVLVIAGTAGWVGTQARPVRSGFATPQEALHTFFDSAKRHDFATAYSCYYQRYHERVTLQEYIKHRNQAAPLQSYTLGPVATRGDTAEATATLVFAASAGNAIAARTVAVREDLVREADGWKIRVW